MTDFNLVIQGNISLLWLQECLNPDNQEKTISQLRKEFEQKNENVGILNIGSLMMAAYLLFVYPREGQLNKINYDKIQLPKYKKIKCKDNITVDYFVRRLRNSIAHSRFEFKNEEIIFKDFNARKHGENEWEISVRINDFGYFLNEFMFEIKNQYYK